MCVSNFLKGNLRRWFGLYMNIGQHCVTSTNSQAFERNDTTSIVNAKRLDCLDVHLSMAKLGEEALLSVFNTFIKWNRELPSVAKHQSMRFHW
jgi:hypothetical protein